eukprot:scaffold5870_cov174-Alexandrium_tamarense.AAC.1
MQVMMLSALHFRASTEISKLMSARTRVHDAGPFSQQSTGNVAVAYILFTVALHTASVFALQSAILLLVKEGEERLPLLSAFTSNFGINFAVIDGNGLPPDLCSFLVVSPYPRHHFNPKFHPAEKEEAVCSSVF